MFCRIFISILPNNPYIYWPLAKKCILIPSKPLNLKMNGILDRIISLLKLCFQFVQSYSTFDSTHALVDHFFFWVNVPVHTSWLITFVLTHLPLVPHVCVRQQGNIGLGNCLTPVRRQTITWTNADLLSIGPVRTNIMQLWIEIYAFVHAVCEMAAILSRGRCANYLEYPMINTILLP